MEELSLKQKFKRNGSLLWFLLPAVVIALFMCYTPMVGILMAFKSKMNLFIYSPLEAFSKASWTFDNFTKLFSGSDFSLAFFNTLIISFCKIVFLFPVPILFAILLSFVRNKHANRFFQSITYLPHFLSWAVVTGIFMGFFSSYGFFNNLLIKLGLMDAANPVVWFQEPSKFLGLVLFTEGWKETGCSMIIYISAILAINPDLFEASDIDGAGKIQQIFHIILPSIKGTIATMFIFRICYIMDAGFDQLFTMLTPATESKWQIIGTYIYNIGLKQSDYTFSTAVGLFNSAISLMLILFGNWVTKKFTGKGII